MNYSQNQPAYDPYSSAEYKAAQAQANKSAQASIRAAQEAYGGAGMGRSYALGERAQGISSDANNYLMTQVVPQLMAAEQQRRQSEYNNTLNALTQLMSQQNRADGLVQQDFNNNLSIADMTGNYMPQGAQQIINQLLGLKQQAESQGTTADQRAALSNQANTLRAQLQAMGIDTSRLGSDVSLANASANLPTGIRTLAGQDQDLQRQNANLDAALAISDLTGRTVTPQSDWTGLYRQAGNENTPLTQAGLTNALNNAWATAQQLGYVTPELAALTGIPEGTRTLDAERIYSDIDARIYNSLADQAATQTEAAEGMNVSQISTNINRALSAMGDNANLNSPTVRNQVEQMILTQTQDPVTIAQLYSMYGIPIPEDLQAEISGK